MFTQRGIALNSGNHSVEVDKLVYLLSFVFIVKYHKTVKLTGI